jgi:hypothetical protein
VNYDLNDEMKTMIENNCLNFDLNDEMKTMIVFQKSNEAISNAFNHSPSNNHLNHSSDKHMLIKKIIVQTKLHNYDKRTT